jgi:hypothetical protein
MSQDYQTQQDLINFEQQKKLNKISQNYQSKQDLTNFKQQKELLDLQQKYQNADIKTNIITDEATGQQLLINTQT